MPLEAVLSNRYDPHSLQKLLHPTLWIALAAMATFVASCEPSPERSASPTGAARAVPAVPAATWAWTDSTGVGPRPDRRGAAVAPEWTMTAWAGTQGAPTRPTGFSDPPGPRGRSDARGADAWPTFTDVTAGSGLESFVLHCGVEPPKNWILESIAGGVAAFDADGDADMDLLFVDGTGMADDGEIVRTPGAGARLFRNDGGFRFTDVTEASGLGVAGFGVGAAAADYDGDGDQDVCIAGYDLLHVMRNRGDGTFEDVTAALGIVPRQWDLATGVAWGDVNGDGRLDLFVTHYVDQRAEILRTREAGLPGRNCGKKVRQQFCGPRGLIPQRNRLFFQGTDGRFDDVSATHLTEDRHPSFQAVFCDFDGDGDLDAYVANDGAENSLLVNDGSGRMTDRAVEAGAAMGDVFQPQGSMGVAVADYDRDGRMDVFVTNFALEYNALYRNRTRPGGNPSFADVSASSGISPAPFDRVSWGTTIQDFDADGELDAFVASGHVYLEDPKEDVAALRYEQPIQILRGLGPPKFRFEDVSAKSGAAFATRRCWRGAVFPDLDDDGDADIVVAAQLAAPLVLRNDGGNRNAWVRFVLQPRNGAPSPAGARVRVTAPDGSVRIRDVQHGSTYCGSDDPRLLMGFGSADRLPRVEVRWPDGTKTVAVDVPVRTTVVLKQ